MSCITAARTAAPILAAAAETTALTAEKVWSKKRAVLLHGSFLGGINVYHYMLDVVKIFFNTVMHLLGY